MRQTIDDVLNAEDTEYLQDWSVEAASWDKAKFYDQIAKTLDTPDGYLHIDFGTGLGNLPRAIKRKNPRGSVIGIEKSTPMIQGALYQNQMEGHKSLSHQGYTRSLLGPYIRTTFKIDPSEKTMVEQAIEEHWVIIIQDDLRSLNILEEILGKRPVTSGSYTLPGNSRAFPYEEFALGQEIGPEAILKAKIRALTLSFAKADHIMTKRTRSGSIYTIVDRIPIIEDRTEEASRNYLKQRFGKLLEFWDPQKPESVQAEVLNQIKTPMGWKSKDKSTLVLSKEGGKLASKEAKALRKISETGVIIMPLQRKSKKY